MQNRTRYIVQVWDGDQRVGDESFVSPSIARGIVWDVVRTGRTCRLIEVGHDYCEVYPPDGPIRRGTFAETTLVTVPS